jgi:hypothetical protein
VKMAAVKPKLWFAGISISELPTLPLRVSIGFLPS